MLDFMCTFQTAYTLIRMVALARLVVRVRLVERIGKLGTIERLCRSSHVTRSLTAAEKSKKLLLKCSAR